MIIIIKYIIAQENENIQKEIEELIYKIMMTNDRPFDIKKIHSSKKMQEAIKEEGEKIYILDVDLKFSSSYSIVNEIRNVHQDFKSSIIILTTYYEKIHEYLSSHLLIFDYILLFDNYKNKLEKSIKKIIKMNSNKLLNFYCNNVLEIININDIIYIYRDSYLRKTIIVTANKTYETYKPLYKIIDEYGVVFFKINRSFIINVNKIVKIDFKNDLIYLNNNDTVRYSRRLKNEIKKITL